MVMTIKELKESIARKEFKSLYLFCGEEAFLVKTYVDSVKASALADNVREFNLFEFDGSITVEEISGAIDSYPQMSEKKVVVIRNSGLIKAVSRPVKELLEDIPDYAIVIFVEESMTKVSKPLAKIFEERGAIVEFNKQQPKDLCVWANQILAKAGKRATESSLKYLVDICGGDMVRLSNELDKLIAACKDREEVSEKVIRALVSVPVEYKMYEIVDKLLNRKAEEVYGMIAEFKVNKEYPTVIISAIFSQVFLLVMVKELAAEKHPKLDEFFPANRRWLAKKMITGYRDWEVDELKDLLDMCVDYDYKIKSGEIDMWVALEIIVARMLAG